MVATKQKEKDNTLRKRTDPKINARTKARNALRKRAFLHNHALLEKAYAPVRALKEEYDQMALALADAKSERRFDDERNVEKKLKSLDARISHMRSAAAQVYQKLIPRRDIVRLAFDESRLLVN